jgi:hypothetical protein
VTEISGGDQTPSELYPFSFDSEFNPAQIDDALGNIRVNIRRGLPFLQPQPPHDGTLVIAGGGPSIEKHLKDIPGDGAIFTVNGSHDYLIRNGIIPDAFAFMEVAPWPESENILSLRHPDVRYFISSQCDPGCFEKLEGHSVTMWHPLSNIGEREVIEEIDPSPVYVGGSSYVAIKLINIGLILGFSKFKMFGVDSSFEDKSHAYMDRGYTPMTVQCAGRSFKTCAAYARQADEFRQICSNWHRLFELQIYGDGLLPHMHRAGWPQYYGGE